MTSVIKFIPLSPLFQVPTKAHPTDACFDLVATTVEDLGEGKYRYGLGFSCELPNGYFLDLRPRSSIHKAGMVLSNSPGTGDEGYTGEYMAVFYHTLPHLPKYEVGDKVVQCRLEVNYPTVWEEVKELSLTSRGSQGYGSSGK